MNGKYPHGIFQFMKIIKTIKIQLQGLSTSISRYPTSTMLSFFLFVLLIMLNEKSIHGGNSDNLERLSIVTALGFFLSISLTQLLENFKPKLPRIPMVLLGTLGFMLVYYSLFLKEINTVSMIRSAGTFFFFLVAVFYTLKLKNDAQYERYVMKIFSGFFITFLYALVVFLGVSFIILTINALFDANIDGKWYLYTFYASTFIFGSPLLLSKLPEKDEAVADTPYSKVFRALLLYIIIPLIMIYTVILYVYFIKILITMEWPRGLVSNLVLWYAAFSVGVIFFISPLVKQDVIARLFKTWFPRVLLPILGMMFVSIGKRIFQYGFTESRYYVVLLGLFVFIIMGYFALRKASIMISVPVLLSLFVLISVYGPTSALEVSYYSQNQRLTAILKNNDMLGGDEIIAKSNVSEDTQKNLSSIVSFFVNRNVTKMKYVDESFTLSSFSTTFGFTHKNDYDYAGNNYYYIYSDINNQPVLVKGYDYLFTVDSYPNQKALAGYEMTLKNMTTLIITKDNKLISEENLTDELKRILALKKDSQSDILSVEESIINYPDSKVKIKIYLKELTASSPEDENPSFENVTLQVLFTP